MCRDMYGNMISFMFCIILSGVVICDENTGETQTGFTLVRFTDRSVVSVQCNCQQLAADIKRVLSINLKLHVSTSESLHVASLYPYGKFTSHYHTSQTHYIDSLSQSN